MRRARSASSALSPSTTRRAGKGCCACRAASIATSSGPIPAGSPAVIAMLGCAAIASKRQYVDRRRVAKNLHIDIERCIYLAGTRAILFDAQLAVAFDRMRRSPEQPQEFERVVD